MTGAIFVNNYVLTQFLGMCPFFGVSRKTSTAAGMGVAVTFVMTISSILTYVVDRFVLIPLDIVFIRTIVFILIIASTVQFIEIFMKKLFPVLYSLLGVYLPLITTNCAIFGAVLINVRNNYNFIEAAVNGFCAGIGFTLAIIVLSGIREKYENNQNIPALFKGLPLALFSAGFISLAFMGFNGLL